MSVFYSARRWLRLKLKIPQLLLAGGKCERFVLTVTPVSSHRGIAVYLDESGAFYWTFTCFIAVSH
jgi:hypothetical protein